VNHVVVEDSQAAPDIIVGMILVNDNNVIVLFNSGASRSFVTTNFVQKHNLPLSMLKNWKIVSSPGGEMHARHVCPKVSNLIRGVRIPSQPHSSWVKRNWHDSWNGLVSKHNGMIDSAKNVVRLATSSGKELEYVAENLVIDKASSN
jgi:hypothetical protein